MNVRLLTPVALLSALLLTHCGEASSNSCGSTANPELGCGPDAACVWTDIETSECLPKCEAQSDCPGETCYPRPHRTSNAVLEDAYVCYQTADIEYPRTESEFEERQKECRARELDVCSRDARCYREYAEKVNLDQMCNEPMPIGCLAPITLCTLSIFVAENSAGELFILAMGCGNEAYTALNFTLDDPLYQRLFEGETTVYEWPRCN